MSYSPWGQIDNVTKYMRGVSFVSTPSHGGFRVSLKVLKERACDTEFLLKNAIVVGNYAFFEEDCDAQLFLFDCPSILKIVANADNQDENVLFGLCQRSVTHWHPEYFTQN